MQLFSFSSTLIFFISSILIAYSFHSSSSNMSTTASVEAETRPSISYKDSFWQWVWSVSQREAEQKVLDNVSLVHSPRLGITTAVRDVAIDVPESAVNTKKSLHLHEFAIESEGNDSKTSGKTLVMMHGYGAGLGFFFKNFDGLSEGLPGWNIYALDWLGYGLSSRPKFAIKTNDLSKTDDERNEVLVSKETEDWFVESLEAWRRAKQISQFTLMGHSMGGYLAAAYAFRYPQHVEKLVMVSPAGVERGYTSELDERSIWSLFKKDQERIAELENQGPEIQQELTTSQTEAVSGNAQKGHDSPRRSWTGNKYLIYLWNNHVSPLSLVRYSSIFGPKLMSRWSYWRFAQFPAAEREAMHIYTYKTFVARPSGEYAITRILAPGALARMPLVDRVQANLKCPSAWIYGDNDWMHVPAGAEAADVMNRTGKWAEFHVVPKAGHHVYLDNVSKFNNIVLNFIKRKA